MLEHYFVRPRTVDRIRALWLGSAIDRYVEWMHERQAAAQTVRGAVQRLVKFDTFAQTRGATAWEALPAHAEAFIAAWIEEHSIRCRTPQDHACVRSQVRVPVEQMLRLLLPDYVGTQRIVRIPFEDSVPAFFTYLREERGLRPTTLVRYRCYLKQFEAYLARIDCTDFSALTPAVISAYIVERAKQFNQGHGGRGSGVLRTFLRYLHREALIATDLSRAVPRGRNYRQSSIPRSISQEDVQRAIDAVDRRDAVGKRDYAIMMLLTTYGLRAREIAAMQIDHVAWQQEQLHVTARKGGHSTIYPLSAGVGEAIIDYLRNARPNVAHRDLFTIAKAPYTPISHHCVAQRASLYIKVAGIDVRRPGSHTFRHSCVQRMVDADVPFKVIGDYVGHRVPESTQIYSKVAVHKLRALSIGDAEDVL